MEKKNKCAYCEKESDKKMEAFCGKPCCEECREKLILMNKVENNKMLSTLNSRYIKYGILKYGSLLLLLIAVMVIFTGNGTSLWTAWVIAAVSVAVHIFSVLFRKKYKATIDLLLEEYRLQIRAMDKN